MFLNLNTAPYVIGYFLNKIDWTFYAIYANVVKIDAIGRSHLC